MAEAVLVPIVASMASAVLKPVLTKCGDALLKTDSAAGLKSAILGNLKPKLEELQTELTKLDGLLSGAEMLTPEQLTRNGLLSAWLKRVKEAAIFADNLLEDISYYQLRRQAESNSIVSHLFRASDGISIRFCKKIGSKLSKFKSMAAAIYKEAAQIGIQPAQFVANPASYQVPAATSTDKLTEMRKNADRDIVVGRQLDEDSIVQELCRTDNINNEFLGVIAMVGMSELPEWLGDLSSLQVLDIGKCPNLKNLPSSDAMQRLTQLRELKISLCPKLEESCRKGGKEWHKISHLPIIRIFDDVKKIKGGPFALSRWNSKGS